MAVIMGVYVAGGISGAHIYGFPSPDSDYDCRFIFVRRLDDYLSPWPKPDYIEKALSAELDINGWELGKSLKLILKGNAVVLEWLRSPIVYHADAQIVERLRQFAAAHASRDGIARHYLHLGERQRRTYFADHKAVQLKKLFYALRPAAALRWMRMHPSETSPPMDFPTLLEESDPPADLAALCAELIAQKRVTRELGEAASPPAVVEFVDSEFAQARETFPDKSRPVSAEAVAAAESLFRDAVRSA